MKVVKILLRIIGTVCIIYGVYVFFLIGIAEMLGQVHPGEVPMITSVLNIGAGVVLIILGNYLGKISLKKDNI